MAGPNQSEENPLGELEQERVVHTPEVTHVRCRVSK